MVVEVYKIRNATVSIHDDAFKSREESIELVNQAARHILRTLNAQRAAKAQKEAQIKEESEISL